MAADTEGAIVPTISRGNILTIAATLVAISMSWASITSTQQSQSEQLRELKMSISVAAKDGAEAVARLEGRVRSVEVGLAVVQRDIGRGEQ